MSKQSDIVLSPSDCIMTHDLRAGAEDSSSHMSSRFCLMCNCHVCMQESRPNILEQSFSRDNPVSMQQRHFQEIMPPVGLLGRPPQLFQLAQLKAVLFAVCSLSSLSQSYHLGGDKRLEQLQ